MEKALFTTIEQVSFTVRHLDRTVKYLSDVCGIGPWSLCNFGYIDGDNEFNRETIKVADTIVEGRYVGTYAVRIAQCVVGNVEIELIEPMDEKSIFSSYLKHNGPGGQHLAVDRTEAFGTVLGIMAENGYPLAQLAKIDDIEDCAFVDHMRTLGTYLELHRRPEDFSLPEVLLKNKYPKDGNMSASPLFSSVETIAFAVVNAGAVVELMEEKYGIGPWEEEIISPVGGVDGSVLRRSCRSLNVAMELLQPISGVSAVERFLRSKGPGIMGITMTAAHNAEDIYFLMEQAGFDRRTAFMDTRGMSVFVDHLDLLGAYLAVRIKQQ